MNLLYRENSWLSCKDTASFHPYPRLESIKIKNCIRYVHSFLMVLKRYAQQINRQLLASYVCEKLTMAIIDFLVAISVSHRKEDLVTASLTRFSLP